MGKKQNENSSNARSGKARADQIAEKRAERKRSKQTRLGATQSVEEEALEVESQRDVVGGGRIDISTSKENMLLKIISKLQLHDPNPLVMEVDDTTVDSALLDCDEKKLDCDLGDLEVFNGIFESESDESESESDRDRVSSDREYSESVETIFQTLTMKEKTTDGVSEDDETIVDDHSDENENIDEAINGCISSGDDDILSVQSKREIVQYLLRTDRRTSKESKNSLTVTPSSSFDSFSAAATTTAKDNSISLKSTHNILTTEVGDLHPSKEMITIRAMLPAASLRSEVLSIIGTNRVVVVEGETGSGKTTQIPAFILEQAMERGEIVNIAVTEPRRLAAVNAADRVAVELGCNTSDMNELPIAKTGQDLVGFHVRLRKRVSQYTQLLYCTTGVLLQKLSGFYRDGEDIDPDAYLSSLTHIIVDEVHERQLDIDFLLTIIRERVLVEPKFAHIRVVLMSASLDLSLLTNYFKGCAVVSVPGRMFHVEIHHWDEVDKLVGATSIERRVRKGLPVSIEEESDEEEIVDSESSSDSDSEGDSSIKKKIVEESHLLMDKPTPFDEDLVADLCIQLATSNKKEGEKEEPGQCVLVFLSGTDRIQDVEKALQRRSTRIPIVILHGNQTPEVQKQAFVPLKYGWRIVLSTNVAETSVTLPDVTHVIDVGTAKVAHWDAVSNVQSLREQTCSAASMKQRAGRAGRVRAGHCWRLYSPTITCAIPSGLNVRSWIKKNKRGYVEVEPYDEPEIRRVSIEGCILKSMLLMSGSTDKISGLVRPTISPMRFLSLCMQPPTQKSVALSLRRLVELQCVVEISNEHVLTPLGAALARLPVDIHLGRMLLMACMLGISEDILGIVSALSCRSPFLKAPEVEIGFIRQQRWKLVLAETGALVPSDHILLLAVLKRYSKLHKIDKDIRSRGGESDEVWDFCCAYRLSRRTLEEMSAIKGLLRDSLIAGNWLVANNDDKEEEPKGKRQALTLCCLAFGLAPNVLRLGLQTWKGQERGKSRPGGTPAHKILTNQAGDDIFIHPSASCLAPTLMALKSSNKGPRLRSADLHFMFHRQLTTSKSFVLDCTFIPTSALLLFGCLKGGSGIKIASSRGRKGGGGGSSGNIVVDGWLHFKVAELPAVVFKYLAREVEHLFASFVLNIMQRGEPEVDTKLELVTDAAVILVSGSPVCNIAELKNKQPKVKECMGK